MALTILPAARRGPSAAENAGLLVRGLVEMGNQHVSGLREKEAMAKENEAIKQLTGMDPSGIRDPKARQTILAEALKGQRKKQETEDRFNRISGILNESEAEPENRSIFPQEDEIEPEKRKNKLKSGNISDKTINSLAIEEPQIAKVLQHQKDVNLRENREEETRKRKEFESDREYHSKRSDPVIASAENIIKEAPIIKGLANEARRAVESGKVEGLSPYIMTKLGFDPAIPPEVATFMSAQKHAFLGDLKGLAAGARPNQFLEKLLSGALPTVGRPKDSNLAIMDMDDFIRDMKVKRAETELQLADEDIKKFGFAKSDLSRRADAIMNDYVEEAQDKLAYSIRNRRVSSLSDDELAQEIVKGNVVTDQPLTQREAKFIYLKNGGNMEATNKEIRKKGYKVLKKSVYGNF